MLELAPELSSCGRSRSSQEANFGVELVDQIIYPNEDLVYRRNVTDVHGLVRSVGFNRSVVSNG